MTQPSRTLMEMLNSGDLIKPDELARGLNVSRPTVYSWVRQQTIPYVKLGQLVRFDPTELSVWLKARRIGPDVRCPYADEGGTIGSDFDDFEECKTCPIRSECATMAAQRGAR